MAETVTEATGPAPASSEPSGEVAETVTEAADMPGPTLATEPKKTRGKGPKKAAEESKEKDIAAMKVAPKKRGRKAAAVAAPNKEEEETEKKPGSKRGRKAVICLCLSPFMVLVNLLHDAALKLQLYLNLKMMY